MKFTSILWCATIAISIAGCCRFNANSFVNDIEALVMNAEVNSEDWDEDEWTVFKSTLEGMMAGEYEEVKECLEVSEEKRIQNAYERGKDLLISENPIEGLMDEIREGVNSLLE